MTEISLLADLKDLFSEGEIISLGVADFDVILKTRIPLKQPIDKIQGCLRSCLNFGNRCIFGGFLFC